MAEMSERMSYAELLRWNEFEKTEAFPSRMVEVMGAMVCSVFANVNRKKGAPPFGIMDFAPYLGAGVAAAEEGARLKAAGFDETDDEAALILQRAVLAFGGTRVH